MLTLAILLVFGVMFAVFAMLGAAEGARACDHGQVGDPKCEHCPLDGGVLHGDCRLPRGVDDSGEESFVPASASLHPRGDIVHPEEEESPDARSPR